MTPSWWAANLYEISPVLLVSWIFWAIFSVVLHELGHGWAALRCGDTTPRDLGHMTWNPVVHMGMFGVIVFALLGLAFGAMPVDPSRMRGRHAYAYVCFSGPTMNLGLAVTCALAAAVWIRFAPGAVSPQGLTNVLLFLQVGVGLNCMLFIFNLIPVPPLDGSRIAAHYIRPYADFLETDAGKFFSFFGFALLFLFGGSLIIPIADSMGVSLVRFAASLVGGSPSP